MHTKSWFMYAISGEWTHIKAMYVLYFAMKIMCLQWGRSPLDWWACGGSENTLRSTVKGNYFAWTSTYQSIWGGQITRNIKTIRIGVFNLWVHVCVFRENSTKGNDRIKVSSWNHVLLFLFVIHSRAYSPCTSGPWIYNQDKEREKERETLLIRLMERPFFAICYFCLMSPVCALKG